MRGEHTVRIDGVGEFTLAFTLGACAAIEGEFEGRGLQSILNDVSGEDPRVGTLLIIIWAGLKKHHNLTLEEVGDIVTMADAPLWGEAIAAGISSGSPEDKGTARPRKATKAQ